jgi:diadenosine tetraphosphatase ApaH/serine/threonine PP2A family protein phosphatase
MRLALLSDLHANLHALKACMQHAKTQGAQQFAFLGDLVGYCAYPSEVVQTVIEAQKAGAWVLQGNHDAMAVKPPVESKDHGSNSASWTHQHLSASERGYLASLPMHVEFDGYLLVHASAHSPEKWPYVDSDLKAQICLNAAVEKFQSKGVFVGHVHHQALYYQGAGRALMKFEPQAGTAIPVPRSRKFVATVGSVGQPRDGDTRAMYALLDTDSSRLTYHRVVYDHQAAAAAIRLVGLPNYFAERLEFGV